MSEHRNLSRDAQDLLHNTLDSIISDETVKMNLIMSEMAEYPEQRRIELIHEVETYLQNILEKLQ